MHHFALHLLGPFQILRDDQTLAGFNSNKVRALLSYLAVENNRPHSRQFLAGLFWPDSPDQAARANLRRALSNLRKIIGDWPANNPLLFINRQTIQFNPHAPIWVDVILWSQAIEQDLSLEISSTLLKSQSHMISGQAAIDDSVVYKYERLIQAIENFQGSFLEGFSLPNNIAFEEWLILRREQFRHQLLAGLDLVALYYETNKDFQSALHFVRRQVEIEPWSEQSQRHLMRLLAITGHRTAALDQFANHKQSLVIELGVEPEKETIDLYQQIRAGSIPRYRPQEKSLTLFGFERPLSSDSTTFVGRDREMGRLIDVLQMAVAGRGQVIFVSGEAGSGKTMLLHAFARFAAANFPSLIISGGQCNAFLDIGDPYLPFCQILELLTGDQQSSPLAPVITSVNSNSLSKLLPLMVQTLMQEGPDLIETLIAGPPLLNRARALAGGNELWLDQLKQLVTRKTAETNHNPRRQTDLFQQYTRVLQKIARESPLLITLDDLQWADTGSCNLLFHLSRQLAHTPILIIGTYRPESIIQDRSDSETGQHRWHVLESVINESRSQFGHKEVALDEADGQHFIEAFVDREPNRFNKQFRETFFRQTEGHALFTAELWHSLQEQGGLIRDQEGWWQEGNKLAWNTLPVRVEAVISERISRLPAVLQELLSVASIQGIGFTAEIVAQVSGIKTQTALRQLSGLLNRRYQIVRAGGSRVIGSNRLSMFQFRHALFQTYLYENIDAARRAALHETTGFALESLVKNHPQEIAAIVDQLAYHFIEAGHPSKAITYLSLAGNRAVRISALEEAINFYNQALALLEKDPLSTQRTQKEIDLLLALGVPLLSLKGYANPKVQRVYQQARQLCSQIDAGPELIMALFWLSSYYAVRGDLDVSLKLGKQMIEIVETAEVANYHTVMAHLLTGLPLFHMARFSEAAHHFQLGSAAAAISGVTPDIAYHIGQDPGISCLIWAGQTLIHKGFLDQAQKIFAQVLTQSKKLAHPYTLAFSLLVAGVSPNMYYKQYEIAYRFVLQLVDLAIEQGFEYFQVLGLFFKGLLQAQQALLHDGSQDTNEISKGIADMQQALAIERTQGTPLAITSLLVNLADILGQTGQIAAGFLLLDEAKVIVAKNEERYFEPELYRVNGLLLCHDSTNSLQAEDAEKSFWQAIETASGQQARHFELRATVTLCRLWQQQGKTAAAQELLSTIYYWFTEGFDFADLKEARQLLSELTIQNTPIHH